MRCRFAGINDDDIYLFKTHRLAPNAEPIP